MSQLIISNLNGYTPPINVFGCDAYGNQCILLATLTQSSAPPEIIIDLPAYFDTYPQLTVKLTSRTNCDLSQAILCRTESKQYQSGELFFFMDATLYDFQNV